LDHPRPRSPIRCDLGEIHVGAGREIWRRPVGAGRNGGAGEPSATTSAILITGVVLAARHPSGGPAPRRRHRAPSSGRTVSGDLSRSATGGANPGCRFPARQRLASWRRARLLPAPPRPRYPCRFRPGLGGPPQCHRSATDSRPRSGWRCCASIRPTCRTTRHRSCRGRWRAENAWEPCFLPRSDHRDRRRTVPVRLAAEVTGDVGHRQETNTPKKNNAHRRRSERSSGIPRPGPHRFPGCDPGEHGAAPSAR